MRTKQTLDTRVSKPYEEKCANQEKDGAENDAYFNPTKPHKKQGMKEKLPPAHIDALSAELAAAHV